ncbi:YSIRK-type signal peptide-containing protein [Staphylococcus succinus]|uniref:YSIRK-type signal peptide-containing protein n=1 Tax=Staphylococcus succinus TaxID=61015 RepID=UPI001304BE60|nr:YSIRK-type signal peptide-containing protein [Staphylococcus succinus]
MKNNCNFMSSHLNKYSIRKLTVGTASLLIGATLVFGLNKEAKADEIEKNQFAQSSEYSNGNSETLKENDEASTVNEEHIDSDATSENQPTNNVEMKKANLSQITSENQNTANINAEEDNDNFQLPSKEKDIISNVDDTTEGVKGDIIDELDKPNTSKTSKDDFNKQSTVHTKSSEYKHNVESENAKDKIIDVQTSQNAPSMTKAYSQSSKEPIGKKEDRKTLRQTRSTQLTAMPKARRNFKTSPNISTREATEDNSLETLPYSDNYTFQSLIFDPENLTEKKF